MLVQSMQFILHVIPSSLPSKEMFKNYVLELNLASSCIEKYNTQIWTFPGNFLDTDFALLHNNQYSTVGYICNDFVHVILLKL